MEPLAADPLQGTPVPADAVEMKEKEITLPSEAALDTQTAPEQPGTPKKRKRTGKISKRELKAVASLKPRWLPSSRDSPRGRRSTSRFEFEAKEAEPLWEVARYLPFARCTT